jgi:hypothetical protein
MSISETTELLNRFCSCKRVMPSATLPRWYLTSHAGSDWTIAAFHLICLTRAAPIDDRNGARAAGRADQAERRLGVEMCPR